MKTISLKKVSAVAVASLGFGVISAIPAFALTDLQSGTVTITKVQSASIASNSLAVGKVYSTGEAITASINLATGTGMIATGDAATVTVSITGPAIATPTGTSAAIKSTVAAVAAPAATATHSVDANGSVASDSHTCSKTWVSGTPVATAVELCTVTFTPTMPGVYSIVTTTALTGATATGTALTKTIGVGSVDVLPATVGTSITALNAAGAQSGGYASYLWMPVGPNAATTTYFATVDSGSIVSAVASSASGTTGTVTPATSFTNGINSTDGYKAVFTLAGTYDSGGTAGTGINPASVVFTVTSASAASQVLTIKSLNTTTGAITTVAKATTTWGVTPLPSAQYSLLTLNAGAGTTASGAAADETATTVANTAGAQKFTIQVVVKDQYNANYSAFVLGASITGPGTIGVSTNTSGGTASGGRSVTATLADNAGEVTVFGDGTSGKSTITITATTAAGTTVVLGSKSVIFVGAPVKATATQNLYIAKAGTALGASPTTNGLTNDSSTFALTPAFTVEVTDANGNDVAAGSTVKMTSSDSSVITVGTCAEITTVNAAYAPGNFQCQVSGATGAASGKTATVTFSVLNPATGLYDISAAPLTFTIGGAIEKIVVSTDKTSYNAGEALNLTVNATDASGNKAYDGQNPYASISSNKTLGTASSTSFSGLTGKWIVNGKRSTTSSTGTASIYAPSTPGSFTISGLSIATVAAPLGAAYSATASVVDGNAGLLTQIDALNAKIVALNALIAKIMKKLGVK